MASFLVKSDTITAVLPREWDWNSR